MLDIVMVLFEWGKKGDSSFKGLDFRLPDLILYCAEHDFGRGFFGHINGFSDT